MNAGRLQLPRLFQQHLPALPGRPPALSSAATLVVLLCNLLLARQPLYGMPAWAAPSRSQVDVRAVPSSTPRRARRSRKLSRPRSRRSTHTCR